MLLLLLGISGPLWWLQFERGKQTAGTSRIGGKASKRKAERFE